MTRSCKNKSWVARSPSSFSNQQMIKSPFTSQIHKMKAKSSGKKVRKYRPFPHKSQHVLDLERQLAMMQERLKAVEERQEKLEADSTKASGPSSGTDLNDTEPRRSSRRSRLREEDTARASTSGRSTLKRKRRTAETDSDESEGTLTLFSVSSNVCSSLLFLDRRAHKVAFIHVGEGGERDLEDHLRGSQRVNLQIVSSERLPDIDATDVIHGLDSSGTSRDYVDESHRCNTACPVGCQGHLRSAKRPTLFQSSKRIDFLI